MIVKAPAPFSIVMIGPEGPYELKFRPYATDPWEGEIDVVIAGEATTWSVEKVFREDEGLALGGMAGANVWKTSYWFMLWPDARPPRIEYWGEGVIWRTDIAVEADKSS
ncbi:hypothetical protein QFZ27_001879 [Inquilinus ginsengisoli]|uniref:hypothetical protein n=1 Tax=Inquilinus ginsengisoli TaxID=363840 RepID=UPI003D1FB12B